MDCEDIEPPQFEIKSKSFYGLQSGGARQITINGNSRDNKIVATNMAAAVAATSAAPQVVTTVAAAASNNINNHAGLILKQQNGHEQQQQQDHKKDVDMESKKRKLIEGVIMKKPKAKRKKTDTNSSSSSSSSAKKNKNTMWKYLNYTGLKIYGSPFDEDWICPRTWTSHDLSFTLNRLIIPAKINLEIVYTIDTTVLTTLVNSELKKHKITLKSLATAMGHQEDQSQFNRFLREPRRWLEISTIEQKRVYYELFLWLNLECGSRLWAFESDPEDTPEIKLPKLRSLIPLVKKEMTEHGISIKDLAIKVLDTQEIDLVINLINSPLYQWNLLPFNYKLYYSKFWGWLRLPRIERNKIKSRILPESLIRVQFGDFRDTAGKLIEDLKTIIGGALENQVTYIKTNCLSTSLASQDNIRKLLTYNFDENKNWESLDEIFRQLTLELSCWMENYLEQHGKNFVENSGVVNRGEGGDGVPSTDEIGIQVLMKLKRVGISVKDKAASMGINRNKLSSMCHHSIPWEKCNRDQESIYKYLLDFINTKEDGGGGRGRGGGGGGNNSSNKRNVVNGGKRLKAPPGSGSIYTSEQSKVLHESFALNDRPSVEVKSKLAKRLNLPLQSVTIFFNNKRRKLANQAGNKIMKSKRNKIAENSPDEENKSP